MIEEATVKSQAELDFAFAVIKQHSEATYVIKIKSREDGWLSVTEQPVNCHVEACDSSHVEACDSSHVEAYGSSHVEAYQYAIVRKVSKYAKVESAGAAVVVNSTDMVKHFTDARDWLAWWGVPTENGTAVLYKAVRPDFHDFYTGKIEYATGSEVEAPDWIDPYREECGRALHVSPRIFQSGKYAQGKAHVHLKCQINVEDIRILPEMSMPDKCRVRKLKVLCQVGEYDDE